MRPEHVLTSNVRAIIGPNARRVYQPQRYCTVTLPKSFGIEDISWFQFTRPWLPMMSMRGNPEPLTM
jgi:hypothetical protein